jgi:competence protein ComEC
MKRKLAFALFCYMAGGGLYLLWGIKLRALVLQAVIALVFLFVFLPHGRTYYITAMVFFCFGITAFVLYAAGAEAVQRCEDRWVYVEGRVEPAIGEEYFLLDVDSLLLDDINTGYRGKLMVYPGGNIGGITVGCGVVAEGQIKLPADDGYRNYCRGLGAEALLYSTPYHIRFTGVKPYSIKRYSWRAALWVKRQLDSGVIPQRHSEIMKGLLLGGREVSIDTRERFSAVGISHLLAVSGLHVGIISAVLVWALKRLGLPGRERFLTVCGLLTFFSFMVGLTPSVVRAAIMMGVVMLAAAVDRKTDMLTSLLFTAFLLIAFQPHIIYSISFQLSFMACLGIVLFYPVFRRGFGFAGRHISGAVSVTLSSQVLILPLLIHYFGSFAPVAVLANILAVPLAGVVLWLTVVFLVLYPLHIPLYYTIVWVNGIIIEIINYIIDRAGAIPFGSIQVENAGRGFYFAYYIVAVSVLLLLYYNNYERGAAI